MSLERRTHENNNPLLAAIEERMGPSGTMPFDEYMGICNVNYYSSLLIQIGDKDGSLREWQYDFSTKPEITPLFGFLMAKQVSEMWEVMGKPEDFRVVEMGGGNGTLAYDIIHGLKTFAPELSVDYTIVEQSPVLAGKQRELLSNFGVRVIEGSAIDQLPNGITGVFISNELFDDLPAKMVRKKDGKWEELFISRGDLNSFFEDWREPTEEATNFLQNYVSHIDNDDTHPISISGKMLMDKISASLNRGFVISVDYFTRRKRDPFRNHPPLGNRRLTGNSDNIFYLDKKNVGNVNITSLVDFRALAASGEEAGLMPVGDVTVGGFVFGLDYHRWLKIFDAMNMDEVSQVMGSRIFSRFLAENSLLVNDHRVLIQEKGVNLEEKLSGAKYTHHDSRFSWERVVEDDFYPRIV